MATMYYDRDADLSLIQGRKVGVIGYGSQGHAHALNLKDSGVSVRVGLPASSRSRAKAEAAGLDVAEVADVANWADVIMVLVPDTTAAQLYTDAIAPNLAPGKMLMFAHGFNIRFGTITVRPDVDVTMIAPKAPGHRVRELYVEGAGTPALVAVHQDATGKARGMALSYAKGIGVTRAGVIETTFAEETETDLFGEQAVLCGGVSALIKAGFQTLVEAGLSARGRLLRVPARDEADRRPDLPGWPQLHALLDQRHRRTWRLHRRPAHRHRRDQARDEEDARRNPQRAVRQGLGRRKSRPAVTGSTSGDARSAPTRSSGSAPSSAR